MLGAGFSAAMGGPLFGDLFSRVFDAKLAPVLAPFETFNQGRWMYIKGASELYRRAQQLEPSIDPESFLERSDAAAHGLNRALALNLVQGVPEIENRHRERLKLGFYDEAICEITEVLRNRLALESNLFLQEVPTASERWLPYDRWFSTLTDNDTIITTNYDCLIEELAKRNGRSYPGESRPGSVAELLSPRNSGRRLPSLLKVHGSVDWYSESDGIKVHRLKDPSDLLARRVVLGSPGVKKKQLAGGDLAVVWEHARDAIQTAEILSIVGYSFPPSDNLLRMFLLDSIGSNRKSLVSVNLILGARSERGFRAQMILQQALRGGRLGLSPESGDQEFVPTVTLPSIYAQDYLPYYRPQSSSEANILLSFSNGFV